MTEEKTFLTSEELSRRWNCAEKTLSNWRISKKRVGPSYIKIRGQVVYELSDVKDYEQKHKILIKENSDE
jgi:hypothetical protein